MKTLSITPFFLFFCGLLISCQQTPKLKTNLALTKLTDSLTIELQEVETGKILPGFVVSIFTKDSILYQRGFGYADMASKKKYSIDDVQIIASITKTLVGVTLMKTVEDGLLTLDDQINDILPFKVFNPNHPKVPITLRHLATHTSTIDDLNGSDHGYRFESPLLKEKFPEAHHKFMNGLNKTTDISMADYLKFNLSANGKWYDKKVFTNNKPGSSYEYSNLGIALLAHIIEIKTEEQFNNYTSRLILKPLKMSSSTWSMDEVKKDKQITYYNEIYNEVPKYYIITYPDGGLYSSVSDMTIYLQEMMKGYYGESKMLKQSSFQEMMKKQYEGEELTEGLCWDLSMGKLIGHAGNDFGTSTLMYFSPKTGVGRILFTNVSTEREEQEDAFYGIYNTLFQYEF